MKNLEETPEFKEFFESLTSETKVLPSLESQKKAKNVVEPDVPNQK